ncbi:MAG TPA: caspase family protein [Hyphomicrobiaceae bacterium]|nr:caspase family protein [Hyphomicrobiaceae bacterium]
MSRLIFRLAVCIALLIAVAAQASAEKRVALVIGNGAYVHAGRLPNPPNDAADIAEKLKQLKFEVVVGRDLDNAGMRRIIRDFRVRAEGVDVALLFYAGHGMQIGGGNVLLPIDAKVDDELDVEPQTIRLDLVLAEMERAARVNVVLLDACRDNPLAERLMRNIGARSRSLGLSRGLAKVDARGSDTLIMFATAPGDVAADGRGRNSPFTVALLKHLAKPEELSVVLKDVVADVRAATGGQQRPQQLAAMERKLYLAGLPASSSGDSGETAKLKAEIDRLRLERERMERERTEAERKSKLAAVAPSGPAVGAARLDRDIALKIQSILPLFLPVLGTQPERFAAALSRSASAAGASAKVEVAPPNSVVPFSEILSALNSGRLDAAWGAMPILIGRDKSFEIFSGQVPFGHDPARFVRWIESGGRPLLNGHARALRLHVVPCAIVGQEGGGWFKKAIQRPEDLRGLRVRWYGSGNSVMQRVGALAQSIGAGNVHSMLTKGELDGTEFSLPSVDATIGFHTIARHYYFPGWHAPALLSDLTFSRTAWDKLGPATQRVIEETCRHFLALTLSEIAKDEAEGLAEIRAKPGVEIRPYPPAVLAVLRKAANEIQAETSANDAGYKAILDSYRAAR